MWHAHLYKGAKIMRIPIRLLVVLVLTWVADAKSSSAATIAEVLNQQPAFDLCGACLSSSNVAVRLTFTEERLIIRGAFDGISHETT